MAVKKRKRPSRTDVTAPTRDSAVTLIQRIADGKLDSARLTTDQRRACVAVLCVGKHSQAEVAHLMQVHTSTIRKDITKIREELGGEVQGYSLEHVLGDLAMTAERCSAEAFKLDDPGLAWKIKSDFVKHLRDMKIIGDRRDKGGIRVTIESIGDGYDQLRDTMAYALDPVLAGVEIPTAESKPLEFLDVPALPLGKTQHDGDEIELSVGQHPTE